MGSEDFDQSRHSKTDSNTSSLETSYITENINNFGSATEKLIKSNLGMLGHRQTSSYDTSLINTSNSKEVCYQTPATPHFNHKSFAKFCYSFEYKKA